MKIRSFITKRNLCWASLALVCSAWTNSASAQQDNVVVAANNDGVTVNNPQAGAIVATGNAIRTQSDTQITNAGLIDGGVNGVNFENGLGSGTLTNTETGTVQSDSRAVNIGGEVTLNNSGQILGTGNQRNGTVYSDSVANNFSITNSGTIDAGQGNQGSGVALEIGTRTTADIDNSGVIQGRTNTPGVAGNSGLSGDGLRLGNFGPAASRVFDGSIVNQASGRISSESQSGTIAGVRFTNGIGFQGSLDNAGEISGANNGLYFGTGDHTGGVVDNTGAITSDSRALNIDGQGLEVNNSGVIAGTGDQRNGTVYADWTAQGFTLNNDGAIDAGLGNLGAGFSAELSSAGNDFTINNGGQILGRGNASAGAATAGDGIRLERTRVGGALDGSTTGRFTGSINNSGVVSSEATSGTTGGFRAVNGVDFQGELTNEGTIKGSQNGVYFGTGDHTGGRVVNDGTISSDSRALNIDGDGLKVENSGVIVGTGNQRNGTVYADDTANNYSLSNSGLIDAGEGNAGAGVSLSLGSDPTNASVTNSGTIRGRSQAGAPLAPTDPLAGDGLRLEGVRGTDSSGGVTFAPSIFAGEITNSGKITAGDNGSGSTAGFHAVNGVSFQGTLNNEKDGVISGANNGVYFGNAVAGGGADHTGGVFNNAGTVSSDSRALNIDGTGLTVNNTGDILGTGNQRNGTVYADSTAQDFTLNNDGNIDAGAGNLGAGFSVELSEAGNDFTINNRGSLTGRGNAGAGAATAGDGIRLERTRVGGALDGSTTGLFTGTINNSGSLTSEGANGTVGGFRAVNGVDFQGTLTNTGEISGTQNGVYFGTGDHSGGVVNNLGRISSDSRAVNIDGSNLVLNNLGSIDATGRQRNGTVYVDGTADNFTVRNLGSIDASGGAGSGISVQVGSFAGDVQSGTIFNSGSITGSGDFAVDAGVRLFSGAASTTFNGDIFNQVGGSISGGSNSAAVLFDSQTSFDGTLFNDGLLDGSVFLNDGDLFLSETSVLELEIGSLFDFEEIVTSGDITFDGILDISFADGFLPVVGQTFDLFDFGDVSGQFAEIRSDGFVLDTGDVSFGGSVSVIAAAAVPEPSAFVILSLSSLLMLQRRRRDC